MTDLTPRLGLPYLQASQAQKHVTHNEALALLDGLVQLVLEARDATDPPASPPEGALYALATSGATGAWTGQDGRLALQLNGAWVFVDPQEGWRGWDRPASALVGFTQNAGWQPVTPELNQLPGVGIGTDWDPVNRLAVVGDASLFSHAGAHHRMTLNKAAPGDDASQNYQTNWSSRALCGLLGSDDFTLKVSPDGTAFHDAVVVDHQTGQVRFPSGLGQPKFQAYKEATDQALTTSPAQVAGWDGIYHLDTAGFGWDATGGTLTLHQPGTYFVSFAVSTDVATTASRSASIIALEHDAGSGFVPVIGARHRMYNRTSNQGGTSASWTGLVATNLFDEKLRLTAFIETGVDDVEIETAHLMAYRM